MAELFPTTLVPTSGTQLPDTYNTIRPGADSSSIITLQRWGYPKMRGGKVRFLLDADDLEDLREFWAQQYGGGTPFDFRYPWPDWHSGLYVGVGDGATATFDVPGYDTDTHSFFLDGVQVSIDDYAISPGSGANGRDQVVFDAGSEPGDGDLITIQFSGQRMILAVMSDELNVVERGPSVYAATISLDEV